jgi:DHA2 family multidrug resistance protein
MVAEGEVRDRASARRAGPIDWVPRFNPWLIAISVFATFMEVLDTAVANVSLPHIAGSLSRPR